MAINPPSLSLSSLLLSLVYIVPQWIGIASSSDGVRLAAAQYNGGTVYISIDSGMTPSHVGYS